MLIGRELEEKIMSRLQEKKMLAGSFLFFGDDQVGKLSFAKELTAKLENSPTACGERMIISPSESKIGIDEIRKIKSFLGLRPIMSQFRSVIIADADKMTKEAQNAALKIVEEPPSYALIIFIARGTESLLSTLTSRLRRIYFLKVEEKKIISWLIEKGYDEKKAVRAAKFSLGRPGLALEFLEKKYKDEIIKVPKKFESIEEYNEFIKINLGLLYNNKNYPLLKKILTRIKLSAKFNTNKKLQLQSIPWTH